MISKKEALEALDNEIKSMEKCKLPHVKAGLIQAREVINNIQEVNATDTNVGGKWIPVSERLPEENIPVLTCDKTGWISVNINIQYHGNKNDFECGYYVAWMPLPEPYKGE